MLRLKHGKYTFDGTMVRRDPIDQLNALLKSELAAIYTYRFVIMLIRDPYFKKVVRHCLDLHCQSAEKLKKRIRELEQEPVGRPGVWQSLIGLGNGTAGVIGDKALQVALLRSEIERLEEYEYELTCLDGENLRLVQDELTAIQDSICSCLRGLSGGSDIGP